MPTRNEPAEDKIYYKSYVQLYSKSIDDFTFFLENADNKNEGHNRILVRTFVVSIEAFYSCFMHTIEFYRMKIRIYKDNSEISSLFASFIDNNLTVENIEHIYQYQNKLYLTCKNETMYKAT